MSAVWGTATSGLAIALATTNVLLRLRQESVPSDGKPPALFFLLLAVAVVSTKTLSATEKLVAGAGGFIGALALERAFLSASSGNGVHFSLYAIVLILLGQAVPFVASATNLRASIATRLSQHVLTPHALAVAAVVMAGVITTVVFELVPPVLGASFCFFIATLFTLKGRLVGVLCIAVAVCVGIARAVDRLPDGAILPAVVGFVLASASLVIGLVALRSNRELLHAH